MSISECAALAHPWAPRHLGVLSGRKFYRRSKTKRECVAALRSGALFGLAVIIAVQSYRHSQILSLLTGRWRVR